MILRNLKLKDADLMLEWMHDREVVADLNADFISKSFDDCIRFIKMSLNGSDNTHLAIVDNDDVYQGTVSLKNIENYNAEFAIVIRTGAMGRGVGKKAMDEIIDIGFNKLKLCAIYWYVSLKNKRAIRFYEKNGYKSVTYDYIKSVIEKKNINNVYMYKWYYLTRDEWKEMQR